MKFEKDDKGFVIWWIDRQFATNPTFPSRCCCAGQEGEKSVSRKHVVAYREWTKLTLKRRKIRAWIEEWMDDDEQAALKDAIKNQHHYTHHFRSE